MSEINNQAILILSLNRALLGEITPNIRAIYIVRQGKDLQIKFVFYSPPDENELEAMGVIGTETIASFTEGTMTETYEVMDSGAIIRQEGDILVYRRKD